MDEFCEDCGDDPCVCDEENDCGYECQECGYVPTHRELQAGRCPECHD